MKTQRRHGFTLIETLIALLIASLLGVSMTWFFIFAQRAQSREMRTFKMNRDVQRIENIMQRHLHSAKMDGGEYLILDSDNLIVEGGSYLSFYSPLEGETVAFFRNPETDEFIFYDGKNEHVLSENVSHLAFYRKGTVMEYELLYESVGGGRAGDDVRHKHVGYFAPRVP